MSAASLEIVEGPDAGRQVRLAGPLVLGRSEDADLVLEDAQVSRRHARVSPAPDGGATVEDLDSANGTFVNRTEVRGPTRLADGDDLAVGVTVLTLRTAAQIAAAPSAVRRVPPALVAAERRPDYVDRVGAAGGRAGGAQRGGAPVVPDLDRLLDVNVRYRARTAPLAIFVLVALIVAIYLGAR